MTFSPRVFIYYISVLSASSRGRLQRHRALRFHQRPQEQGERGRKKVRLHPCASATFSRLAPPRVSPRLAGNGSP